MDAAGLLAVVLVAVAALAVIVSRRRAAYAAHVAQLNKAKKRRTLVVGEWTREEVAKHRSADDLWLIIRYQPAAGAGGGSSGSGVARVYDLTDYVDEHPGGLAIMFNAGGDATEGFHGPQHPPTVHELVRDYCIGTLKEE